MSQESDHTPITAGETVPCLSAETDGTQVRETSALETVHLIVGERSTPDSAVCSRCASPVGAGDRCGKCGAWLPANMGAVKTGERSTRDYPAPFDALRTEVEDFMDGQLTDEGDQADISTRRRSLLEYRSRIHRRILQVDGALELHGLTDRRGRLRTAWLQRLEALIRTAQGIDSLLGLERRQRSVGRLADYVNAPAGASEAK